MTKRRDPEAIIVQFFTEAPPEAAAILFRVVRGIVDSRGLLRARPTVGITDLRPATPRLTKGRRKADGSGVVVDTPPAAVQD